MRTLYDVLGVDPSATAAEIHNAYRRLARKMHPDAHPNVTPDRLRQIEQEMATINQAWEVLSDPDLRDQYNREHGIDEAIDRYRKWLEPPLPAGFDYWPRRGLFARRTGTIWYSRIGDAIHEALSLVPLGNDLSSLRELWPNGVWRLEAQGQKITDDHLTHIAGLTGLLQLDLADTHITDRGLEHLTGLTKLNSLGLAGTSITDAGMIHISRITSIEALTLCDTKLTDLGLSYLKNLQKLDYLDLRGTEIRGPGLTSLRPIQDLDVLLLPYGIPKHFRVELRDALPHLEIRH